MHIYAFADEANARIDLQIAAMKRNNLNGLEIRNVDGENVSAITLEKAREVHGKLKDNGLVCWSIGSPIGKIDIVKDDFNKHLDSLKHTLDVAAALDCRNIRLFSFYLPKDQPAVNFRNEVMDRMGKMLEAAEGSGIALCHENEKGIYGDMADRCLELLRAYPALKGIFDPANFIQCGQETLSAWAMLKDRIHYMHIKDALADGSVVPAGKGIGHVGQIVKEFMDMGGRDATVEPHLTVFSGFAALEQEGEKTKMAYTYPDSDTAFDAACNAFKELL